MAPALDPRLDSARQRLERGRFHLEPIREAESTMSHLLVGMEHPEEREIRWYLTLEHPLPADLAVVAADALHNLRCALDHAMFAAVAALGGPISESQARHVYWPIDLVSPKSSRTSAWLPPAMAPLVDAAQPFRSSSPKEDPLGVLHELDRLAKHRALNVASTAVDSADIPVVSKTVEYVELHLGPIAVDRPTPFLTVRYRRSLPDKVHSPGFKPRLVLIDAPRSCGSLIELVETAAERVRRLIDDTEHLLP